MVGEVVVTWFQALSGCLSEGTKQSHEENLVSEEDFNAGSKFEFGNSTPLNWNCIHWLLNLRLTLHVTTIIITALELNYILLFWIMFKLTAQLWGFRSILSMPRQISVQFLK